MFLPYNSSRSIVACINVPLSDVLALAVFFPRHLHLSYIHYGCHAAMFLSPCLRDVTLVVRHFLMLTTTTADLHQVLTVHCGVWQLMAQGHTWLHASVRRADSTYDSFSDAGAVVLLVLIAVH